MVTRTLSTPEETVTLLNALLRGELAAVATYGDALEQIAAGPGTLELTKIRSQHFDAVQSLRAYVTELGGKPETSAGPWGAFAEAIESTAQLLGDKGALQALKAGELAGAAAYENALAKDIPSLCFTLIHSRLLPQTREHVTILEEKLAAQSD